MLAEDSPVKGECDHTGNAGGEDNRFLETNCVLIQDSGWTLVVLSEAPYGVVAGPATPGGWLPAAWAYAY